MISKRMRTGYALALAALLALPCLPMTRIQAANGIDLDASCSITVSVSIGEGQEVQDEEYVKDFREMQIPVDIYQVAAVDVTGQNYTPAAPFESLDLSSISNETTAAQWQELAGEAAQKENLDQAVHWRGNIQSGVVRFEDLTPGLYLVVPAETYNRDYTIQYAFTPYLTALPSSEYALTGEGDDTWNYDTEIGLKPEAIPQYGRLNITKILSDYNETLGQTSFAFLIEGRETPDPDAPVVYSDVISTTHGSAGDETAVVEKIPAGLYVTVKEIYSGASYRIVGDDTDSALIWSDAAVEAAGNGETVTDAEGVTVEASGATVTFTNEYGGGNRGGYGVTNHFDSDGEGGWHWENPTTPIEE